MYVRVKKNSYFLNMINNDSFVKAVFYNKESLNLTRDNLIGIKKNIKKMTNKYNILFSILSLAVIIGNEEFIKRINLKLEHINKKLNKYFRELEIFESKLAYLLLKDILKIDKVKYFGFDDDYIKNLIYRYQKMQEIQYDEYYYNEKNAITSMIDENGIRIPLPYTPTAVRNKLEKLEHKQNNKRIIRNGF